MTTSYHLRQLCTILTLSATLGTLAATQVTAGANPDFRIVLHAKPSSFEPCNGYLPVDCATLHPVKPDPSGRNFSPWMVTSSKAA